MENFYSSHSVDTKRFTRTKPRGIQLRVANSWKSDARRRAFKTLLLKRRGESPEIDEQHNQRAIASRAYRFACEEN